MSQDEYLVYKVKMTAVYTETIEIPNANIQSEFQKFMQRFKGNSQVTCYYHKDGVKDVEQSR